MSASAHPHIDKPVNPCADNEPELTVETCKRIRDFGVMIDPVHNGMSFNWWCCPHGFVSMRNQYCRWGCNAHALREVVIWRSLFRNAIHRPSSTVTAGEHHAGFGEFTPRGDTSDLLELLAPHAERLELELYVSRWLCCHGFVDCWQPRCVRGCCATDQEWRVVAHSNRVAIYRSSSIRANAGLMDARPELTSDVLIDMVWVDALIAVWLGEVGLL